jgi:outer membrane protein assembly factor BamB
MLAATLRRRTAVTVVVIAMVGLLATPESVGAAAAGPAVTGTGDWAMFGDGQAHNAVNRAEQTLSPSTVHGLRPLRTYPSWGGFEVGSALVVGNIGYGQTRNMCFDNVAAPILGAFDLSTGKLLWQHSFGGCPHHIFTPAISSNVLYVDSDTAMWAFNATTGAQIWTTPVAGLTGPTTFANGHLVYASSGNTVYAFNAANGRILWSKAITGSLGAVWGVAVQNGLAYVFTDHLIAFNATTGALVFNSTVKTCGKPPVVSNEIVFAHSCTSIQIVALSATTGRLIWSANGEGGTPAVDGSTVIVGGSIVGGSYAVIAYDASTGHTLWTNTSTGGAFSIQDSIANGVVYDGSDRGLMAIDERTGKTLFRSSFPGFGPIVSHGRVYAFTPALKQFGL